jgi:anti-sigma factor RsiW
VTCENEGRLFHGYFDGELDLVRSLEFEDHLKLCPDCAGELRGQQAMRQSLRTASLLQSAPKSLRTRILATMPRESQTNIVSTRPMIAMRWFAAAAAIAVAIFVGAMVMRDIDSDRRNLAAGNSLAHEIVSSHVRSLQPGHLFDVQSTDQHTVKPWFDGKLDFAPPMIDLADRGFPLVGGRLDYLGHREVAALVYQRRKHLINVFVWREDAEPLQLPDMQSLQGYNLVFWKHDDMDFCAASDLGAVELQEFVQLLQR